MNTILPIQNALVRENRATYLSDCQKAKIDTVLLCFGRNLFDTPERREAMHLLCENVSFFREAGIRTGVWLSSLGHGGTLPAEAKKPFEGLTNIVSVFEGRKEDDSFCPLDERFTELYCDFVKAVLSSCKPDFLFLDDDFRLSVRHGDVGCACDKHLWKYGERLGRVVKREELPALLFGKPNFERAMWQLLAGETLENFARAIRAAADETAPDVGIGLCASPSTFGFDGTDAVKLERILAGKNPAILRLIGAPYWASGGGYSKLPGIIEKERLESVCVRDAGMELWSEGDAYPRPRFRTPAVFLEGFDFMLRADGKMNGILKYMCDYLSTPHYERGYLEAHERHLSLHERVESFFEGKQSVGVRVYDTVSIPKETEYETSPKSELTALVGPLTSKLFVPNSIPTAFEGGGCGAVFGKSAFALDLSLLKDGMILDAEAARILQKRGVDVGFSSLEKTATPSAESFDRSGETITITKASAVYEAIGLSEKAEVLSTGNGKPLSYLYTNAKGERLAVFLFDVLPQDDSSMLLGSYERAGEILWILEKFGKTLPAVTMGHPDLYLIEKEGQDELSVAFFNAFPDEIRGLSFSLAEKYRSVESLEGTWILEDDKVTLDGILPAFGFGAIRLKKVMNEKIRSKSERKS